MTIRREIFKTNSDLTIAEYTAAYTSSGTALQAGRTGELVVDLADPAAPVLYIANNTSVLTAVGSGGTATSLVNGSSNVVVAANSNITMGVAGNANVFTINGLGNTTIGGTLNLGTPALSTGVLGLFSSSAAATTFISPSGIGSSNTTIVLPPNAGSNGSFLRTDGANTTGWATTFGNGTSNVSIPAVNGNVTITAVGNTTMTITGTGANIAGTANVTGALVAPTVRTTSGTFSALPAAATAGAGARGFITDGNTATFNSQVTSGGSNAVPVFSDGTNWKVG